MTDYPSARFARELVATLADAGVTDVVLCPGSRSGPLAHALAEAGSDNPPLGAPRVNLHVRIDERSAAFLALGIARGRGLEGPARPVAVVTTSGTAVGNLLPAVMEAYHSGVPLLLLTADRPGELRGVGANQTTDQVGIFGTFVRWSADVSAPDSHEPPGRAARMARRAIAMALGDPGRDDAQGTPGPVHLDLEFRDPLASDNGSWENVPDGDATPNASASSVLSADERPLPSVERGIVIAGDGAGDRARQVAEAHGWPLLSEPTSGARCGHHCIGPYLDVLKTDAGQDLANQVEQVVVVGRPTLTRAVQELIRRAPALFVAGHGARWREGPRHAERMVRDVPDAWLTRVEGELPADDLAHPGRAWLARWRAAANGCEGKMRPWGRRAVAATLMRALTPSDVAFLGSSGPIRAVDRSGPVWDVDAAPTLLANRGLSGIDGTVSTAAGVALALERPTHALVGDLTFLHDVGGMLVGTRERTPLLRMVVVNDRGGTIFRRLEHARADPALFERVFTTPHDADLGSLCAGYGVGHVAVRSVDELRAALTRPLHGVDVIEAVVD